MTGRVLPVDGSVPAELEQSALAEAVDGLRRRDPSASAAVPFVRWQRWALIGIGAVVIIGFVLIPQWTAPIVTAAATLLYLAAMAQRIQLFVLGLDDRTIMRVSDEEACAIADHELPRYTVLVPAYGEPEVISQLLTNLGALDYPADRLEILILLEADDEETVNAARAAGVEAPLRLVLVPPAEPRTKPKACNYGMQFADGEIVTIYDAEDRPDPLQLRRAVILFRRDPGLACVQARLAFHNGDQNLLTAWFTAEYGLWFSYLLPGLSSRRWPVPLGGTSNHLRADVLAEAGGWDPYNVTEDADLGLRLARRGYRTGVLDSVTWEEANSDPINWIRQRSRWYKGYLQSCLVALRRPLETVRVIGVPGTAAMILLLAGTPIAAATNLIFWMMTVIWVLGQPAQIQVAFPPAVYYASLISFVIGNVLALYSTLVGARARGDNNLLVACLLTPLYWFLMAVAALKGIWQLLLRPSYWEKTVHGLDQGPAASSDASPESPS
ncbi:glycosyltransferase [Microlunatus elymi]|uniref:Glycosyltransferase n=1 Tax=Microlunatus elymi TaxID=2596828 RepID=A0A516PWZ0_9ACTN|nr:glycosyltransferase [Microlunatus elymi]QDP95704.1 glycosyltransferase [Microlunatus elymi]